MVQREARQGRESQAVNVIWAKHGFGWAEMGMAIMVERIVNCCGIVIAGGALAVRET